MIKTTVEIEGMMCRMCEKHMSETLSKNLDAKSVSASHEKGMAEIISETAPEEEKIKSSVAEAGYKFISCRSEPYEKKFSLFGKN
ncbi:MAG: cation transporter [Ruminococcus sp.]|nr:cation transporter [Ruminococcus sp.]